MSLPRMLFTHFPKICSRVFTAKQSFRPFGALNYSPHKLRLFAYIFIAFLLVFSSYSLSLGRTVQLNLAFSIGTKDDNITVAGDYVSSQDANVVLAIVSSGTTTGTGNVTAYSSTEYLLQLTQSLENNRFLITFTNASNQTIADKLKLLGNKKILPKAFGNFVATATDNVFLFLRAEYDDVDITTRVRWGTAPVQLIIKNIGGSPPQITVEMVK